MIKIERTEVQGFEAAVRGMRNPLDSWDRSDSRYAAIDHYELGENDRKLAERLIVSGPEHGKFLRMIVCWADITAPLFWWKQFDTYRIGVEKNACSTMHRIMAKPFTLQDFSFDSLYREIEMTPMDWAKLTVSNLNDLREQYLEAHDKAVWRNVIEMLPESYNQKRTVMMSYQALRGIVKQRRAHRLEEWHSFIKWAGGLPESWMLFHE